MERVTLTILFSFCLSIPCWAQSQRVIVVTRAPSAQWASTTAYATDATAADIERLRADPNVLRVDLDVGGGGATAVEGALLGIDRVVRDGYRGSGVTVAVLDTGVDGNHPDLAGRVIDEHCFCEPACCPGGVAEASGPGSAQDDHGHGTRMAGVLASRGAIGALGLAPDVRLIAVKVMDSNNRFSASAQVISGLQWILENHPETRVVNLSLATDERFAGSCDNATAYTIAFAQVIAALRANGTIVVTASGNAGDTARMSAPACVAGSTAVGATYVRDFGSKTWPPVCTDNTTDTDVVACFSNSSGALDLLAPGVHVVMPTLGGGTQTGTGTSPPTAIVSSAAALLLSIDPALSPQAVENVLKDNGIPVLDARTGQTFTRIDAARAVRAITGGCQ